MVPVLWALLYCALFSIFHSNRGLSSLSVSAFPFLIPSNSDFKESLTDSMFILEEPVLGMIADHKLIMMTF